jgi:hypothetical protein
MMRYKRNKKKYIQQFIRNATFIKLKRDEKIISLIEHVLHLM